MTAPTASIPVAWLKPFPAGYKIPMWRWVLLPATTFMLKRYGGVWINGTLDLAATELRFTQSKVIKGARSPAESWAISFERISQAKLSKGVASETLEIHHEGGTAKLMMARADRFVDQLKTVIPLQ